jgi:protein arginine N-methyltransferase 1
VKTDLVISETLGNFATEEHIIENMEDAKRFLKPGGMLIPENLRQFIVPLTSPRVLKDIDIWKQVEGNLDLRSVREYALQNLYVEKVQKGDLLPGGDALKLWDTIDFRKKNRSVRTGEVSWRASKNLTVYGFAAFWECDLVSGITLSTSPFSSSTHWDQIVLPLLKEIKCVKGDTLKLKITSDTRHTVGLRVQWEVKHTRGARTLERESMDTN